MGISRVDEILHNWKMDKSYLIEMLQDVQDLDGYIAEDVAEYISDKLEISKSQIFHIGTFYTAFTLKPKGKYQFKVCTGTACHVRGGTRILEQFERELDIKSGDTTDDLLFSLDPVRCVGCCGLAPVVLVNEDVHGKFSSVKIKRLVKTYRKKNSA